MSRSINLCKAALGPQIGEETGEIVRRGNGDQFADYLKLLAYSGARRTESLHHLKWYWKIGSLLGSEGWTKNGNWRAADSNPKLDAHLKEMLARKAPDPDWMFPSPRRGEEDRPAKTLSRRSD